jgi:hypothetical protein
MDPEQGNKAAQAPTLAQQLQVLREHALSEVKDAAGDVAKADRARTMARSRLGDACAVAIDVGLSAEDVAVAAGVSAGTVRGYATVGKPAKPKGDAAKA